ncbi:MAG TPA: cytochrome c biogenesis protein CcsA [Candidatus Acidoferrales bacterium]|nr:cytochrome c biogenesis protein CcsA [Candidatus Acidoferrales bacterium]
MTHPFGYLSLMCYAASLICYARILYAPNKWIGRAATLLLASGIGMQYVALLERAHWTHTIPYDDLYGSMLLFAWLLGITYLALELLHRQRAVGALVTLFLAIWIACLMALAPEARAVTPPARGALFAFHVTLNTWAYAAFALSFLLSLVYLVQNRVLRSHRMSATFWRFPSLDVLDRMARSSVWVGLGALVLGVGLGLAYEHRLSGGYAWGDPKVMVTLLILAAYAAYLRLSRAASWRGARAALLCACNFAVVLFSYTFVNLYLTRFHRFF